jgi:general secretion pathway protein D
MTLKSTEFQSKRRIAAVMALSSLLVWVVLPAPAAPQQPKPQEGATITPNYKDADLGQIIQAVGEVTGKNFIIDPRVNAKVTMVSSTPMSPAAFYEAFLAVLQVYGYVAVPSGKVIKIVPNTDLRQLPANDLPNNVSSTSDEIVTQIVTLKNVSAAQLVPMLRPLIPTYGHLAAYPGGNMLIISDRASNVSRVVRIIQRMDESGDEPIEVIPLHNAGSADVVKIVNSLNQGAGAEAGGAIVKIVADERTNSILLTGERSARLRLKALIINMDTPMASGGDIQVRYLRYADAEKIADKLKGQATASAKAQGGPPVAAPAAGGGSNVDASVTIWADVATNALIITAPPKIMKSLMGVIDKLDIRRAQVQVEAIIVEVDVNKSSNLGVQWLLFGQGNSTVPAGIINLPGTGTSIVDLAAAALGVSQGTTSTTTGSVPGIAGSSTINSSTVGTGATVAIGRVVNNGVSFAALIQALRSDGSSNIISTPSLITMNNEEAEVKVTQEIPLITGSFSNTTQSVGGTSSPFQTIQREEVGTILKVTPHINEGNSVQLKIEQEDSSPGAKLTDSADISTNKRSIKTTVLIEDGGIIVLGGLMSDTVTESEDRVPGLGAIPIIGNLFKSRSGSRQKKNLVVFIRPRIMRDADATESTSEAKYNEVRRSQQSITGGHITLLPGEKQPVIPSIPSGIALPAAPPASDTNAQGATPNPPQQFTVPQSQPQTATPPPTPPPEASHP